MDLLLKTVCASYMTEEPWFGEIQLVQKSLAIGLSRLLSSERGSLAWALV